MRLARLGVAVLLMLASAACTAEDATPIDQLEQVDSEPVEAPDVSHSLEEPSEEMRELAEQQCLDDPELEVGEITAVDPDDPSEVLMSVTVDCFDVR